MKILDEIDYIEEETDDERRFRKSKKMYSIIMMIYLYSRSYG
jgi:hypothetical protein